MIAIVLIALAAGSASALMFASIISGALISLVLFYLSPLPLMVTAIGWGPLAATIAGIAALTTIAAMLTLGTDAETIAGTLRRGMLRMLGTRDAASAGDVERWV